MKVSIRSAIADDFKNITVLSRHWEDEQTHGVIAGFVNDYCNSETWVCYENNTMIGYLSGRMLFDKNICILSSDATFFQD